MTEEDGGEGEDKLPYVEHFPTEKGCLVNIKICCCLPFLLLQCSIENSMNRVKSSSEMIAIAAVMLVCFYFICVKTVFSKDFLFQTKYLTSEDES